MHRIREATNVIYTKPVACTVGVLESLERLHTWPHGLEANLEWYLQTRQILVTITAQHSKDAHDHGISPEEHIRKVMAVPG